MRALVVPPLFTLLLAGCALNEKEERALIGGGIGAGAGYLLGGNQGALIGGGAGAILGAVTASDEEQTVVHNHDHKKKHRYRHRHRYRG
jgi:osmotically inducible lipoprotein OsmB